MGGRNKTEWPRHHCSMVCLGVNQANNPLFSVFHLGTPHCVQQLLSFLNHRCLEYPYCIPCLMCKDSVVQMICPVFNSTGTFEILARLLRK